MTAPIQGRRPFAVWLIVLLLLAYGLLGPLLLVAGSGSIATITEVRRTGGAEPQWFHRYWWVVAYEFTAADGTLHGGHTRTLAYDTGPRGYAKVEPVLYLAAAPWLNVLRKEAGVHAGTVAVLGAAELSVKAGHSVIEATVFGTCSAVGFALALVLFSSLRERLDLAKVPAPFQGTAIALVTTGSVPSP